MKNLDVNITEKIERRTLMYLLIDNYDSFTYNLYDLMSRLGKEVHVVYNDQIPYDAIEHGDFEAIIISPGPSHPNQAGDIVKVIQKYCDKLPILGICLGHQAIGEAFGSPVVKCQNIMHGKVDQIDFKDNRLFENIEKPFNAVRYHSLVIDQRTLNGCLEVLAHSKYDGEIMAIKHQNYDVYGLQFHPESYETKVGEKMMKNFMNIVDQRRGLKRSSINEIQNIADDIFNTRLSVQDIKQYLIDLRNKGEGALEIAGFASAMKQNAIRLQGQYDILCDTCGTGGDGLHTFNISTASAFVLASAGINVAKHGNRSVSSKCGSADVLEALGSQIELDQHQAHRVLSETGIVFLFAQKFHPKMKQVMPIRKSIEGPTIFNIIGPVSNPAPLTHQIVGVFDEKLSKPLLDAMIKMGIKACATIHGYGGMDELSLEGINKIMMYRDSKITQMNLDPRAYGFLKILNSDLKGGDATYNANALKAAFEGKNLAFAEAVILNAGFSMYVFGLTNSLKEGFDYARKLIDNGSALEKLNDYIKTSQVVTYEYA